MDMPQFLSRSTVRLLEASLDNLALAMTSAAMPLRHVPKSNEAAFSPVVGLAGVAAEQLLSAIILQIEGDRAALGPDGKYKTAGQVLWEVRRLLTQPPVARANFLTAGVGDPAAHRQALLAASDSFGLIIKQRAGALHGGLGVSRGVALLAIRKVHSFLTLLAESQRISPYLRSLPSLPDPPTEPYVIVDELVSRFSSATTSTEKGSLLRQLFLVLPETPANAPDWLEAFDRVAVVPTEGDISLLMTTLQAAEPARLSRLSGGGLAIPVTVSSSPSALPIEMQALRREFTRVHDQIGADIGSANGRLESGILDPPPDRVMAGLFAMDDRQIADAFGTPTPSAHQAWPFIVAALNVNAGTLRPYWFLVRRVEELGQLRARLLRASSIGRAALRERISREAIPGIEAIQQQSQLPGNNALAFECQNHLSRAIESSWGLTAAVERANSVPRDRLSAAAAEAVLSVPLGFCTCAEAWAAIESDGIVDASNRASARNYWARKLAEAATEPDDISFLSSLILDDTVRGAHTAARRALRVIDATKFGPSMPLST